LPFPLPPLEEQKRIAAEVGRRLGATTAQVQAVRASLDRLPEMESELLAAAVAGGLVPHDPADEPAAALIERLGAPTEPVALQAPPDEDGATVVSIIPGAPVVDWSGMAANQAFQRSGAVNEQGAWYQTEIARPAARAGA
jgi:hypothetical protein